MSELLVNEIFSSVQGEGFHTGKLAIFVRFAGCNLRCFFCDTKYAWDTSKSSKFSVNEVLELVEEEREKSGSKFIVLTGGEPLVQEFSSLQELVRNLKKAGYYVAMESNGTILFDRNKLPIDWLTVSPKTHLFNPKGEELKLLYDGEQNLAFYEQFDFIYFYLQPILPENIHGLVRQWDEVKEAFRQVLEAVRKHPRWRVSFQVHKLVGWE